MLFSSYELQSTVVVFKLSVSCLFFVSLSSQFSTARLYGGGVNSTRHMHIKRHVVSRLCCLVDRRAVTRGSSPAVTGVVTGRDPWDPPFHRGRPRPSHHAGVDMRSDAVVQLLGTDWSINRRRNSPLNDHRSESAHAESKVTLKVIYMRRILQLPFHPVSNTDLNSF